MCKRSRYRGNGGVGQPDKIIFDKGFFCLYNRAGKLSERPEKDGEKGIVMSREEISNKCRGGVCVFVASIPFPVENEGIFPASREEEIAGCADGRVRRQKYFVWKLLERELAVELGLKLTELNLKRNGSGKWECGECCFSLSHCGDLVAVALSKKPVGVDIERADGVRFGGALAERIVTESERALLNGVEEPLRGEAVNVLWTKKEASFKAYGTGGFNPKQVETTDFATATKMVEWGGQGYFITVASADAARAVFQGADGVVITDCKDPLGQ